MTNLFKIFIFLFVVAVGLKADQGMLGTTGLSGITSYGDASASSQVFDVDTNGNNIYKITIDKVYKADMNFANKTNSTFGNSNKQVLVNATNVFVLDDNNLYIRNTDLSAVRSYNDTSTTFNAMAISSDNAFIFIGTSTGIIVVRVSDANTVGFVNTPEALDVKVKDNTLFVASNNSGLGVVDISNPKLPSLDSTVSGNFQKIEVKNDYLYSIGSSGLSSYDIYSPSAPILLGTAVVNPAIDSSSSIDVGDTYAYVGDYSGASIYDVSNKSSMIPTQHFGGSRVYGTSIYGEEVYLVQGNTLEKYTVNSDYPDVLASANVNNVVKSEVNLDANNGVFGELSTSADIDIIELDLPNGKFNMSISGMSDLNVSLYESTVSTTPIKTVTSTSNTSGFIQLVTAGIHYLRVKSTTGSIGEYKITALTGEDDWTDSKPSSPLISVGETLKGNLSDLSDLDYFRVDVTSKGILSFTSSNGNILDINVTNAYDDNLVRAGSLSSTLTFEIPSSGTYFIKAQALNADVVDEDYSFRISFSKDALLDKEDNSLFAMNKLTEISADLALEKVQDDANYVYAVDMSSNDIFAYGKTSNSLDKTYNLSYPVKDYQVIDGYMYILTDSTFELFDVNNPATNKSFYTIPAATKFIVNGNYAYIANNINSVMVLDISDKNTPEFVTTTYVNNSAEIRDLDIKTSFIDGVQRTFIYFATGQGLQVYEYSDLENISHIKTYEENDNFSHIEISNPYAYAVSGWHDLHILRIKRPLSSPSLKGRISIGDIDTMEINQDYAYFTTRSNYLKVVDIKNQTAPSLIDTTVLTGDNKYLFAKGIVVSDGVGYILGEAPANVYLTRYDMAKDYSDTKVYSKSFDFDTTIYGNISDIRITEKDMFYLRLSNTTSLDIITSGNLNVSYIIHDYKTDANIISIDSTTSQMTTTKVLNSGEYYIEAYSTDANSSGSYEFSIIKTDDDHSDNFNDATTLSVGDSLDANLLNVGDIDVFKVVVTKRGELSLDLSSNIKAEIYYDDSSSLVVSGNDLNPGTYYIKVTSDGATGSYTIKTNLTPSGKITVENGFDDISNFQSKHLFYGDRYIYSVDTDSQISVYNHLLQRIEHAPINTYSDSDIQNSCGKAIFMDEKIFINMANFDSCGYGYEYIDIQTNDSSFNSNFMSSNADYTSNDFTATSNDVTIVGADDDYIYEYSKTNMQIYKLLASEILTDSYYKKPYAVFSADVNTSIDSVDDIIDIKNDGNYDFIASSNKVYFYLSDPARKHYEDHDNNVSTPEVYVNTLPTVVGNHGLVLEGNVEKLHLDRTAKKLYILNKGYSGIRVVDYSSGVSSLDIKFVDVGAEPNGFFIKDSKVYISFANYGVKVYPYPLTSGAVAIEDIPNLGVSIAKPFTYDESTIVYTSNGTPKLYLVGESFKDGKTAGTYSVVSDVKEGEGGFEGCFIATAAYGNYFQPNVKILRDFRDDYLLQNELGRIFVDFYYRHSPSIASNISSSQLAKTSVRIMLTPIVYIIKYPLIFLSFIFLLLVGIFVKKNSNIFKVIKVSFLTLVFSFAVSGCSSSDDSDIGSTDSPSLRTFVAHIDANSTTTNTSLGYVKVSSAGDSSITNYTLEGTGYTNFSITTKGEVFIKNYSSAVKYNMKISAKNIYGDSTKVDAVIEVTTLTQPVLYDKSIDIDNSGSSNLDNLTLARDGTGINTFNNISNIEILGKNSNQFSISADDGKITHHSGLSSGIYDFLVRPINYNGYVGPYTALTINVKSYDYNTYDDQSTYDDQTTSDDFLDYLDGSINFESYNSGDPYLSINGYMNFDNDHDYIGFYLSEDGNYTIDLSTNGNYSYTHSGDYIALYDNAYSYYNTHSMNYPQIYLTSGYYFMNIHQTSDYYTATITKIP